MTTKVSAIPKGFRSVNPYLIVVDAQKLLRFIKDTFGAKEKFCMNDPDGIVRHAEVVIGDTIIEFAQEGPGWSAMPAALHCYVKNVDEVYEKALKAGATSLHGIIDQSYGDREGSVRDAVGNDWYIGTHTTGDSYRPEELFDVTSYLSVKGADPCITFLEKAFGATVLAKHLNGDRTVGHAKVRIGNSVLEMSEAHGQWRPRAVAFHHYVENADEVYQKALQAGATSIFEVEDKFYGERSGGVIDAWGNHWYIATHTEDLTLEELKQREIAQRKK